MAACLLQSWSNYCDLLGLEVDGSKLKRNAPGVHSILMQERDEILLHHVLAAAKKAPAGSCVAAVVGEHHLAGMQEAWQRLQPGGVDHPAAPAAAHDVPSPESQTEPEVLQPESDCSPGVKRALLETYIELTSAPDVLGHLQQVLGPPRDIDLDDFSIARETYAGTRMLLAVLDRSQLEQVRLAAAQATGQPIHVPNLSCISSDPLVLQVCCGWQCNMYDVLQPLRAVRPVNGGCACSLDLVYQLRLLHFNID